MRKTRRCHAFDWKDYPSWRPLVDAELCAILGGGYRRLLRDQSAEVRYCDSADGAFTLLGATAPRQTIAQRVRRAVLPKGGTMMAYHACRTDNVRAYLNGGIRALDPQAAQEEFRAIFGPRGAGYPEPDLAAAIARVSPDTRRGRVHLDLDDRVLVEESGHYLIYGSEYISCMCVKLPGGLDGARDVLKARGRATIIACEVPVDWFELPDLDDLADRMLREHFLAVAHAGRSISTRSFVVTRGSDVSPQHIRYYYHPVRIPDPLRERAVWNDEEHKYEL